MPKPIFAQLFVCVVSGAVCVLLAAHCSGKPQSSGESDRKIPVERFLREYLHDAESGESKTTQYSVAFAHLGGKSKGEIVAYVSGPNWCGSGGCVLVVLEMNGTSYKVISHTTIVRLPIRALRTRTNGWRDIGVFVQGGGIQPGYEAALPFDGAKYPSNPTVPPARRLSKEVAGEVLIPKPGNASTSTPD